MLLLKGAAIALSLLSLFALTVGGAGVLYRWQVEPQLEAQRAEQLRHAKHYFEDIQYLKTFSIFDHIRSRQPDTVSRNAGGFLNPKVQWSPAARGEGFRSSPLVPHETKEILIRMEADWMRQHKKAERMKADLSIFSGVKSYDYWDIERGSPISTLIETNEFLLPSELPIPDSSDLLAASKLRLMRAAIDKAPLSGLQEVRQLARLLMTTENLDLVLSGIALLEDERLAYRYFVDEMGFPENSWYPIDRNTTRRAHRAIWGTLGYLRLWTQPDQLERVFLSEATPIGFCAAVNDVIPIEYSVRPLLEPQFPFERDYRSEYQRLDLIFERALSDCRLRYLSHLQKTGNFSTDRPGPVLLNRLPYSRKLFGLKLSVLNFQGFEFYGARSAASTSTSPKGN